MTIETRNISALQRRMISLSTTADFDAARAEWVPLGAEKLPEATKSICGHSVRNAVVFLNRANGAIVRMGKGCAEKVFVMGAKPVRASVETKLGRSLKKTLSKVNTMLSLRQVEWAFKNGLLNAWENNFYTKIRNWPTNRSEKQERIIRQIHATILTKLSNA